MKKFLALSMMVCCMIVFAACSKECEHQYQETITTKASCTATGVKTFTCTKCNDSYTEEIPMSEHTYGTATVTKAATCTEEGEKSKACKVCGTTKIVGAVPKLQHQYNSEVTKESTCTVEGTKTFTCATCSHTYTEEIAKIDHTYTSKVTTEATCTNTGVKTYTCKVCTDSYTEAVSAKGHSYTTKTNSSATCTSAGSATHTCKVCGNSYTETIAAKGHKWVDATCTKAKYCSSCGVTEGNALGHSIKNGKCVRCNYDVETEKKAAIEEENKRYDGKIAEIENYYNLDIKINNNVISDIKSQYGISSVSSRSYYQNRLSTIQTQMTNLYTQYYTTSSATQKASIQRQINSLQAEELKINMCLRILDYQEENAVLVAERDYLIAEENKIHKENLANIEAKYN